jgi:hypothetical protein
MTEWDLLKESEDIKLKDMILVESADTGKTFVLRFVKESKHTIVLKNKDGAAFSFDKNTLEECNGEHVIVGKYE